MTAVPEIADSLPSHPDERRKAILRTLGLGVYLFVVFGILLPSVVDYSEVLAAFEAAPAQALAIVLAIGMFGWVAEGLALWAVMPGLGLRRAVPAYLVMAAVGSTLTGAFKLAIGYRMFREWDYSPEYTVLGLSLNGLAAQLSKLLLPAIAILFLTLSGTFPGQGILIALLLLVPVALGIGILVWVLRSEAFARRVGAFATRASGAVMRRMHRSGPDDLTPRLMGFRESAKDLLVARALPTTLSQVLARSVGYVLLVASMRAVGVPESVLPPDVILGVYAAVMVITLLPIAPGGAGLPELLYISMFTAIVADPAYDDLIAAGVMLMRGVSWFLPIPVGYVVLVFQRRANRKRRAADPLPESAPADESGGAPA